MTKIVGFGYVPLAIGSDCHDVVFWKTRSQENDVVEGHHAGHELLGGPVHNPNLLACVGIVTGRAEAAGEDELFSASRVNDQWWTIGAHPVGAIRSPAFRAGPLIQRDQIGLRILIAVQNDYVLI